MKLRQRLHASLRSSVALIEREYGVVFVHAFASWCASKRYLGPTPEGGLDTDGILRALDTGGVLRQARLAFAARVMLFRLRYAQRVSQ